MEEPHREPDERATCCSKFLGWFRSIPLGLQMVLLAVVLPVVLLSVSYTIGNLIFFLLFGPCVDGSWCIFFYILYGAISLMILVIGVCLVFMATRWLVAA